MGNYFYVHLPYSREQKHVLLFRKSEILHFKVSITNMPHIFFRNKTFLFVKIESWNFQHLYDLGFHETSQNFSSFGQLLFPIEKCCLNVCLNVLKFCKVSRIPKSNRCWKFQLSILTNTKVLFLKKILSVPWIVLC